MPKLLISTELAHALALCAENSALWKDLQQRVVTHMRLDHHEVDVTGKFLEDFDDALKPAIDRFLICPTAIPILIDIMLLNVFSLLESALEQANPGQPDAVDLQLLEQLGSAFDMGVGSFFKARLTCRAEALASTKH